MDKFEKIHNRIKFKAFRKVTIGTNKNTITREKDDNDNDAEEVKASLMFKEQ